MLTKFQKISWNIYEYLIYVNEAMAEDTKDGLTTSAVVTTVPVTVSMTTSKEVAGIKEENKNDETSTDTNAVSGTIEDVDTSACKKGRGYTL